MYRIGNGPIAGPLVLVLAALWRTAAANNFTQLLSNTPAECDVDGITVVERIEGQTYRNKETPSILVRWNQYHDMVVGTFGPHRHLGINHKNVWEEMSGQDEPLCE